MFRNLLHNGKSKAKHKLERFPSSGSMISLDGRRRASVDSMTVLNNDLDVQDLEYHETLVSIS